MVCIFPDMLPTTKSMPTRENPEHGKVDHVEEPQDAGEHAPAPTRGQPLPTTALGRNEPGSLDEGTSNHTPLWTCEFLVMFAFTRKDIALLPTDATLLFPTQITLSVPEALDANVPSRSSDDSKSTSAVCPTSAQHMPWLHGVLLLPRRLKDIESSACPASRECACGRAIANMYGGRTARAVRGKWMQLIQEACTGAKQQVQGERKDAVSIL